jgi:hypothetical protein
MSFGSSMVAGTAMQFSLCCRWQWRVLDHGARGFDVHERAGDGWGSRAQ